MDSDTITQTYAPRLRAGGLRVTQPRLAILEVLHNSAEPTTIGRVHESLARVDCDLVTVYRCLYAFEAIGLVKRLYHRNGTTAFTIEREGGNLFLISEGGWRSAEVNPELAEALREATTAVEQRLAKLGYRDVTGLVQFFAKPPAKS